MAKLNSKDIELLASTIMQQVYDSSIVDSLKKEQAEKAWKEFEKSRTYRDLIKIIDPLFDNLFVEYVEISNSIFKGTLASKTYRYNGCFEVKDADWIKNEFVRNAISVIDVDFPSYNEIYNQVKQALVVECLVWKDLQGVVEELIGSIKAKLEKTKATIK